MSEWEAYYAIEPFGEERADLRAGTIASPLLNIQMTKGSEKTKPSDWIMEFGELVTQDPEQMALVFQGLVASYKQGNKKTKKRLKAKG